MTSSATEETKGQINSVTGMDRSGSDPNESLPTQQAGGRLHQPGADPRAAGEQPWPFAPVTPALIDDAIHVWRANLDDLMAQVPGFLDTLSVGECARAARFRFERDRNRFIVRHGLLREILARYLGATPADLSFSCESRGKPVLAGAGSKPALHFSLSHSVSLALFAISRLTPVGVDLEKVRPLPNVDQIAAKFFSPRENLALTSVSPEQKLDAFFACWTRKEAYLKATGEGIAEVLAQIEVSFAPETPARLLRIAGDPHAASLWSLHSFTPAPGYVGSLAVRRASVKLVFWQWRDESIPSY